MDRFQQNVRIPKKLSQDVGCMSLNGRDCMNVKGKGCTDPYAENYNPTASVDNGSCEYYGCNDSAAVNYDTYATVNDGSCVYMPGQQPLGKSKKDCDGLIGNAYVHCKSQKK